jgi:uncharacterized SAM-dependent methyltransferase
LQKGLSLLSAIEQKGRRDVVFCAVDVDYAELARNIILAQQSTKIPCYGLLGTFEDAFRWIQSWKQRRRPLWTIQFGSTLGNMNLTEAQNFMAKMSSCLKPGSQDAFLISLDHCDNDAKLWTAYHDPEGKHTPECHPCKIR